MSDWDSSYDGDLYETFTIMTPSQEHLTPSPDPLVGEDMSDIERNSPVVIPPTQEQQQQQQQIPTTSRSTNESAGGGGQETKNRLKALLTLRIPQPVEAAPSNQNSVLLQRNAYLMPEPMFDSLWPINLKLSSQKGDCSASHGVLEYT